MLEWMTVYPILATILIVTIVGSITKIVTSLGHRLLRTMAIISQGWPPPHLDADGDWKPETVSVEWQKQGL